MSPRALALAAALVLAAPAGAQTTADLPAGPLGPCLQDHFDPERYEADLAAAGWVPVPDATRAIAQGFLAQAFLALTNPAPATGADDRAARLARAEAQWQVETQDRFILVQGDSLLFLRGFVQPDRFRRVDCWLITPDGAFVDALIAGAAGDTPVPADREVLVNLGLLRLSESSEARVLATRNPVDPGPFWGILTQTLILPLE